MTSRYELKEEIRTLAIQKQRAIDENLVLKRELSWAQEESKARKVTLTALREELDKANANLDDSTREKALSFAQSTARRSEDVLRIAANYELYLRKGVSVPVYTGERSEFRRLLAELFESATEEQASLLSDLSGAVEDLRAAYKAALGANAEHQDRESQLTECAQELVDALVWSAEYAGLPAAEGWSWYDALKKHAPATLEGFEARQEKGHVLSTEPVTTQNADHEFATEAVLPPKAVKDAVISIMSRTTSSVNLRTEVQLAYEWVTEKDDTQDRLSALSMADGARQKAKIIHSLRTEV